MPRGGKNHAQEGGKIAQGGEKISRALRARRTVYFFPPLANFSCTPLSLLLLAAAVVVEKASFSINFGFDILKCLAK